MPAVLQRIGFVEYVLIFGKVDFLTIEPMNFEEFLIAGGEKKLVEKIKEKRETILETVLKILSVCRRNAGSGSQLV